jgi:hypothetical protein
MTAEIAASHAEGGWFVFPVLPNDKKPAIERWPELASADPAKVRAAWPAGHNIGIACGLSGLVVVDLDRGKPLPPPWDAEPGVGDGCDVWAVLRERHDPTWPAWLSTYTVATPSGGLHLYFRARHAAGHPPFRNTTAGIGPMVDTRADGGYVLGAGSAIGGASYDVLDDCAPVWLPDWIVNLLLLAKTPDKPITTALPPRLVKAPDKYVNTAFEREIEAVAGAWEGGRNNQLNKSAYALARFVATGQLDRDLAVAALTRAAETCGLGTIEITRTLRSAFAARGAAA